MKVRIEKKLFIELLNATAQTYETLGSEAKVSIGTISNCVNRGCGLASVEAIGRALKLGTRWPDLILDEDRIRAGLQALSKYDEPALTLIQREMKHHLYRRTSETTGEVVYLAAARLWGADTTYVTQGCFNVAYSHELFHFPLELKEARDKWIADKEAEAKANDRPFFDGPVARVIRFRDQGACKKFGTAQEASQFEIELGRLEWFDFEGLNGRLREERPLNSPEQFEHYLNLSELRHSRKLKGILANIVDCNVTIITTDGYAGYSLRSGNVASVPNKLSSAVSENVNRFKDDATADGSSLNNADYERVKSKKNRKAYEPKGVPHPFWTAKRGIAEELSKRLHSHIRPNAIKLAGLCYNLEGYHPDLLFVAAVDLRKDDVLRICADHPGKDFREGELRFTRASFHDETLKLLADPNWAAGDEASLFRTIELIESLQEGHGTFDSVFNILATAP